MNAYKVELSLKKYCFYASHGEFIITDSEEWISGSLPPVACFACLNLNSFVCCSGVSTFKRLFQEKNNSVGM